MKLIINLNVWLTQLSAKYIEKTLFFHKKENYKLYRPKVFYLFIYFFYQNQNLYLPLSQ